MNIAFSKIGKSIKLTNSGFSAAGGDSEAPAMLRILANNNPDKKFYIAGRSNFGKLSERERLTLFPYDNVIDCWAGSKGQNIELPKNYFKDIKLEAHIMMVGQVGTVTVPGRIKQVHNPELIASVIDMTKGYASPLTVWMNESEVPVIEIINDPRYTLGQSRDIIFNPKVSLSQFNYTYEKNTIESYENQERVLKNIPAKYAEMEKIFLYDRKVYRPEISKRKNNFVMVLNEGKPSRYPLLKEWILNHNEDVSVYGVWDEETIKDDKRFVGSLHIDKLQEVLSTHRSSFCIPIAPGWVTSKYIELIAAGVVPFLHPTYDSQDNTGIPEFLRPKTPEELAKRVAKLNDDATYTTVINSLQSKYITQEYLDGYRLNNIVMSSFIENYKRPDLSKYSIKEAPCESPLDEFF